MARRTHTTARTAAAPRQSTPASAGLGIAACFSTVVLLRGTSGFLERTANVPAGLAADVITAGILLVLAVSPSKRRGSTSVVTVLFFLYCGSVLIGAVPTLYVSQEMAVYGVRSMILAPLTVLLFEAADLGSRARRMVGVSLMLVVMANCLVALGQAMFGYSPLELSALESNGSTYVVGERMRLIGLQSSGQDLSAIVGAAFAWGLAQVGFHGFRAVPRYVTIAWLFAFATSILVLQRSILLGMTTSVLAVAAIHLLTATTATQRINRLGRLLLLLALGGTALAITGLLAPSQTSAAVSRALSLFDLTNDSSWSTRQSTTMPISTSLIGANPWGYGVGMTGSVAAQFGDLSPLSRHVYGGLWPDSGYFFVTLQVGLVGSLVWLAFLVAWAWRGSLIDPPVALRWNATAVIAFLAGSMLTGSFWGLASTMTLVLMLTSVDFGTRPSCELKESPAKADGRTDTALPRHHGRRANQG